MSLFFSLRNKRRLDFSLSFFLFILHSQNSTWFGCSRRQRLLGPLLPTTWAFLKPCTVFFVKSYLGQCEGTVWKGISTVLFVLRVWNFFIPNFTSMYLNLKYGSVTHQFITGQVENMSNKSVTHFLLCFLRNTSIPSTPV